MNTCALIVVSQYFVAVTNNMDFCINGKIPGRFDWDIQFIQTSMILPVTTIVYRVLQTIRFLKFARVMRFTLSGNRISSEEIW